jgi:hypothetical protein
MRRQVKGLVWVGFGAVALAGVAAIVVWVVLLSRSWREIGHDPSSTAAIGYLFIPIVGLIGFALILLAVGAILALLGWANDHGLGPPSTLIVVVLIASGIGYALFGRADAHAAPPSRLALATYYQSPAGGAIPRSAFDRLTFGSCRDTKTGAAGGRVFQCRLTDGYRSYSPCFAYNGKTGSGPIGTTAMFAVNHRDLGCGRLTYNNDTGEFVFSKQCITLPVGATGTRRLC